MSTASLRLGPLTPPQRSLQEEALRSLDRLPPFSPVLNQLLSTLADDGASFARIAATIEKDTVLAANVLRVVNSPLYGRRGTINSVAHAIALLGIEKLRNTALSFSMARLWHGTRCAPGFSISAFNLHSVAVALLSDAIAQRVPVYYPEGAFASGLFHDIGKLMIAVAGRAEYWQTTGDRTADLPEGEERRRFGVAHADLSALALERWNLPRPIQLAVAFHHEPQGAPPDALQDFPLHLAQVVRAADQLAKSLGICALPPAEEGEPEPDLTCLEAVQAGRWSVQILQDFRREYEPLKAAY